MTCRGCTFFCTLWLPLLVRLGNSGILRNLNGDSVRGYISGVHFQKCSDFSIIFFTLKINTIFFSSQRVGARASSPKYAPAWQCIINQVLHITKCIDIIYLLINFPSSSTSARFFSLLSVFGDAAGSAADFFGSCFPAFVGDFERSVLSPFLGLSLSETPCGMKETVQASDSVLVIIHLLVSRFHFTDC